MHTEEVGFKAQSSTLQLHHNFVQASINRVSVTSARCIGFTSTQLAEKMRGGGQTSVKTDRWQYKFCLYWSLWPIIIEKICTTSSLFYVCQTTNTVWLWVVAVGKSYWNRCTICTKCTFWVNGSKNLLTVSWLPTTKAGINEESDSPSIYIFYKSNIHTLELVKTNKLWKC